jgi:hypothetical protein
MLLNRLVAPIAVLALVSLPTGAAARAVCRDPRGCGIDERTGPPVLPEPDGALSLRAPLGLRTLRARLVALRPRVAECFATYFEGARAPRSYLVTLFDHPDGRWSLAFGPRPAPPLPGVEQRGTGPLEVCIADWVSGEIGPRVQPPRGRAPRRVSVSFRPVLPAAPVSP